MVKSWQTSIADCVQLSCAERWIAFEDGGLGCSALGNISGRLRSITAPWYCKLIIRSATVSAKNANKGCKKLTHTVVQEQQAGFFFSIGRSQAGVQVEENRATATVPETLQKQMPVLSSNHPGFQNIFFVSVDLLTPVRDIQDFWSSSHFGHQLCQIGMDRSNSTEISARRELKIFALVNIRFPLVVYCWKRWRCSMGKSME